MIAISLWEPWATAIAIGAKQIETRHWPTHYRGPIAIHAAKTRDHADYFVGDTILQPVFADAGISNVSHLAFGCVVATCELLRCVRVEDVRDGLSPLERRLGNYSDGRYAWRLANVVRLKKPIPAKGKQGFWNWDESEAGV